MLRYEMFKRLNTGGTSLASQEIRNCTARMLGEIGIEFYDFLQFCAHTPSFQECTEPLSQSDKDAMASEELVLRFFAVKNARDLFRGSVRDWLDDYMESVLLRKRNFPFPDEEADFRKVFDFLAGVMGTGAFVRYRANVPIGALAPAYFEAVTIGTLQTLERARHVDPEKIRGAIIKCVQSEQFRSFTGPGANSREKLEGRIETISSALRAL
jgi:hypothetical protein